jgi:hypothetical protein
MDHKLTEEFLALDEVRGIVASLRPWDRNGYGTDGRVTGVVDWYDGWAEGCKANALSDMRVPRACNDPKQWILGWQEAWESGRSRAWRAKHT